MRWVLKKIKNRCTIWSFWIFIDYSYSSSVNCLSIFFDHLLLITIKKTNIKELFMDSWPSTGFDYTCWHWLLPVVCSNFTLSFCHMERFKLLLPRSGSPTLFLNSSKVFIIVWVLRAMLNKQPHFQGAVAAQVQEGQEELLHVQGQEGWLWGDTPLPR